MRQSKFPYQSSQYSGLEALAAQSEQQVRRSLTALLSDPMADEPFEMHSMHFRFSGFDSYAERLAEHIDISDGSDNVQSTVRRTYQFAHQVGTMLLHKPTDVRGTLPAPEQGSGYLDYRESLSGVTDEYFEVRPTLKSLTESYMGALDATDRSPEAVKITAGLAFAQIDATESALADKQTTAQFETLMQRLQ